jgi:RNA polymerase II elongation factor ELL
LAGSSDQDSVLPPQAFVINLSDDVVEQMIRSARLGDELELELGKRPVCLQSSKRHPTARCIWQVPPRDRPCFEPRYP